MNTKIQTYYGHVALNTDSYSAPIYTVGANQSTVNVIWNNCQGKTWEDPVFASSLRDVPIPADAVPSAGSDGEVVIYQPSSDTEWEFWITRKASSGQWTACWGGRIDHVSQNPGSFAEPYGVTGSGLPLLGFLIRVSELRAGAINHTIGLQLPYARARAASWPATRTDGASDSSSAPAEGEHFRLDPTLDLSQYHLPPGELMIARALQRYGAIVTDQSGAVTIQAEDPRPYEINGAPDPYAGFFSGPQYNWLKDIPWSHLQALAWNYGRPGH